MKYFGFLFSIVILSLSIISCGMENNNENVENSSSGFGSISAQVKWPTVTRNRYATPGNTSLHKVAPAGVVTVRAIVTGPGMGNIQQDFAASAGNGTISNVPAGTNRSLTIQGLDSGGTVTHEGTVSNITVNAGQNTSAGLITMAQVGGSGPPPAPTGVTVVAGDTEIYLSWNVVSSADLGYSVYISDSPAVSPTNNQAAYHDLMTSSDNAMTWTGLTNGTTYYCVVTAWNSDLQESAPSVTVSATPQAAGSAPAAPTGLTLTPGDTTIDVSWNSVANADGYTVYINDASPVTTANNLNSYDTVNTSMVWNSVTNGTTYYIAVLAHNAFGDSPLSAPASATPQAALAAPTGVTAFGGDQQAILIWNEVPGATGYNIYYSSSPGVTISSTSVPDAAQPHTFFDFANGTSLYFRVTAISSTNESALSSEVSASMSTTFSSSIDCNLASSAGCPGLRWITAGDALWFNQSTYASYGSYAVQSGAIGSNGSSLLQTYVDGPITLSFWWKVSSEACCDGLTFKIDGSAQTLLFGEYNFQNQIISIPSGTHLLKWEYTKDDLVSTGLDAGFVDEISLY